MTFDWKKIEESKAERRRRLAKLPFAEKLRILDRMRERDQALKTTKAPRRSNSG